MKTNIPYVIHQIIGPNVTPLIRQCVKSWKVLENYGFEIVIWNDDLISDFLSKYHPFAYQAFVKARNHAEAADIARYLIIYTYGGYYVDWDVELLEVTSFLELSYQCKNGYMLIDPPNATLASEYFCATPNNGYLLSLTNDIIDLYNSRRRDDLATPNYSGPYRMRDSLIKYGDSGLDIVRVKDVFAYDYSEIRNPNRRRSDKPLIHYWVHSWID